MIADEIVQAATLPQGDARAARKVVRRRHTRAQVLLVPRARACPERSRRVDRGVVPLNPRTIPVNRPVIQRVRPARHHSAL